MRLQNLAVNWTPREGVKEEGEKNPEKGYAGPNSSGIRASSGNRIFLS
jgi:hypothetical protein